MPESGIMQGRGTSGMNDLYKPVSELALKLHRCMLVTLDLAYLSFKAQDAEASGDEPAISAVSQCCIVLLSLCL